MPLLGQGALAMWWNMAPDQRSEFEHWHSHEHFPERLGVPGFRRGSRWAGIDNAQGYFVLYEVEDFATLTSPAYLARLNDPTPWSTRMMPHHRDMVRSQCRVLESAGSAIAGFAATLRLSPRPGKDTALRAGLREALDALAALPGLTGGHLLHTDTPALATTTEQKIRGGDAVADWIVLANACDLPALEGVLDSMLSAPALAAMGAAPDTLLSLFRLSHSMTPQDLR
jgi:hypothetical protein